jgi:hypothetical protein
VCVRTAPDKVTPIGLGLGGIVDPEQAAGYVCCDAHCSGVGSLCHQLD